MKEGKFFNFSPCSRAHRANFCQVLADAAPSSGTAPGCRHLSKERLLGWDKPDPQPSKSWPFCTRGQNKINAIDLELVISKEALAEVSARLC